MKRISTLRKEWFMKSMLQSWQVMAVLTIMLFFPLGLSAQVSSYSFSESTEVYTSITGTTSTATGDEGVQNGIAIGFPFIYGGTSYSHFGISANGFIRLGTSASVTINTGNPSWQNTNFATSTNSPLIAAFWDDNNVGSGAIKYALSGTAPNQILEVDWNLVNIGNNGTASTTDFASFKIRLHQTSNIIEIIYAPVMTSAGSLSASIGLSAGSSVYLSVTPAATSTTSSSTADNGISATTNLVGKKYVFSPPLPCAAPTAQPTALVLTPTSATTINGTFTAASPTADRYLVVRTTGAVATSPVNGTAYTAGATALGGTIVYAGSATTFASTGLAGNTNYTYYVFSYNSQCTGGPVYFTSSPLSAIATTCPAVPTTVTTSAITLNSFTLTWASSLGGSASPVSYTVDVATDNAFASPVVGSPFTVNDPAVSQVVSGLAGSTTYYYRVRANGSCQSAYSTTANVATQCITPASQPTALVLTPASATSIGGTFTAASPAASGYLVVRTTGAAPTTPVNGTTYTTGNGLGGRIVSVGTSTTFTDASGLAGNTSYTYYVYAYSASCTGAPVYNTVTPLTVSAVTCPVVPTTITTSAITLNSFTLTWASSLGGSASPVSYTVDVATDNAFASPVVGSPFTVNDPAVSQVVSGLAGSTTYYYRVRANGSCQSAYSTTANVATQCITPASQPTALVLTPASATSIGGTFTAASPAASGYLVVRTTGAAPTTPVNGTTYTTGNGLGGRIVSVGTSTTFTDASGLAGNTSYTYYVYAYSASCTGAPVYNTVTPLTVSVVTCPAVPGTITTSAIGVNGFTLNWGSTLGGGASAVTYTVDVATDNAFASPVVGSPYTVANPTVTQIVSGLNSSSQYYYRIRSNGSCNSAYSATGNVATLCTTAPIPVSQGFNATTLPLCWNRANVAVQTASKTTFVTTASNPTANPFEGSHFVMYNSFSNTSGGAGSEERLISLPVSTTGISSVDVEFNWFQLNGSSYNSGAYLNEGVAIQWSTDGTTWNNSTFFPRHVATAPTAGEWSKKTVTLPSGAANAPLLYVAFKFHSEYGYNCYLDAASIIRTQTCGVPSNIVTSNLSANGVDFSWTAPTLGTPVNYIWKIVTSGAGSGGTAIASGTTAHPTVNATASGLAPTTAYQVYIRTDCGGGDSSLWAGSAAFTTPCAASNIPYIMPIQSVTAPALPTCTSVLNINSDGSTWKSYASYPLLTGFTFPILAYEYSEVNAANDWLFTQGLNLTGNTSYRLTYKYNNDGSVPADAPDYYPEKLKVMYGTSATVAGMTQPLADYPVLSNATPQIAEIDFTPATSGVYYIGFHAYSAVDQDLIILDDISVVVTPTCFPPTALTVSNVGGTTANLSWTAPTLGTPANYLWKVVAAGAGANGTAVVSGTVAAPGLSTPISGLSITTAYDVYIRSECGGGDTSVWSPLVNFTTIQNPVTTFPYATSFETGLDDWQTSSGSQPNKWVVGTAVANTGTQSLYISNDNGVSNAYTLTTSSVTHAYRDIQLPVGFPLIQLSFDWRAAGDAAADRMRVWVVPTTYTPTAGTEITATGVAPAGRVRLGAEFSNQPTFAHAQFTLPFSYENQTVRLVFEWRNNASAGTQPPAAIDSVKIVLGTCSAPTALTATTTPNSATLGWTETGGATQWNVEYGPTGFVQGTGTMIAPATNTQSISPLTPSTSYSYYVQADCGTSESPWAGPYNFNTLCQPAAITSVSSGTRCGIGSVALGASTSSGSILNWYANPTGGSILDTGSVFNTPTISASTTYYVETATGPGLVTIGAGASTGSAAPYNPTNGGYGGIKSQYLYTAAELSAAGITPGSITSLALHFTATGSALQGFNVQLGTTGLTTFPTPVSILGGLTTVYSSATYTPTIGVNTFNLSAPFNWDGTSSIIVSTSWSNNNSSNNSSTIKYDATTNFASQSYRKDNETSANMLAFTGGTGTGTSTFDRTQNRPQTTFNQICLSPRVPVTATVTAPPAITASNDTTICAGNSIIINATSANTGYDYVWNPGNLVNAQQTVTPTASTNYVVTATDASGGANNGCVIMDTVKVIVNQNPPAFTITTPSGGDMCIGTTETLTATPNTLLTTVFSENFEGTVNMTTVNTSTGTTPAAAAWTVRPNGYATGGTTSYTLNSPDNSKFILTNSDLVGNGANVTTDLISPVLNTTGYTALTLNFSHFFKSQTSSAGTVAVSIDGGANWTNVQSYTGADAGTNSAFANANINLDTYVNNTNFRIRFRYTAAWNWFWAIDNISLKGASPMQASWTATPAGAGLPVGSEIPSSSNVSVSITPTNSGVFNYVATLATPQGCSATSSATVTVNALPTVDAGTAQSVCAGSSITLNGSGATTYAWDNGVTNGTAFNAPSVNTLYTVTGTDANLCSNTDTVSILILPSTPVTISPAGPIVTCQNEEVTLTANGPAAGPATPFIQWNFNAGNLTPSLGSGAALFIGGTTETFTSGAGSSDPVQPGQGWSTASYPSNATPNPRTAGTQFNVSTVGYQNILFNYDVSHSGSAANRYVVQYSPDVTNILAPWITVDILDYTTNDTFHPETIDLSTFAGTNDNPNLGIRIVSDTALNGQYVGVTAAYGTSGTVLYDMVTFTGNPIVATYLWNTGATTQSIIPTTSGTYKVTVTEAGVCSGTDSVVVTINPIIPTVLNPVICAGESYTLVGGDVVSTANIYTRDTISVATGCDSIIVVNLTVNPVYNTSVPPVTICSNETYELADGTIVDTANTYVTVVPSVNGCDSTVTVQVIVLPAQSVTVNASICADEDYTLPNGTIVNTAGSYTNVFQSIANGCDSTIITVLTVKPIFTATQNVAICSGETHLMPDGTQQGVAGTYTFPYTSTANGCDSTITVNLTVNPVYTTNVVVNLCPGDDYTLVDNTVVSSNGVFTAVTNSQHGCDSTVIVTVTLRPIYNTAVNAAICQGGSYTLANGATATTAGTYTSATHSVYGCDSIVVVTLTVNSISSTPVAASICQGETYTLPNGTSVSAQNVYTTVLQNSTGCDSTIVTTLTVNPTPNLNLGNDIVVANPPVTLNAGIGHTSYLWNTGATTASLQITQSGTYSVTVTNQFGCEATDEVQVNFTSSIVNLGENGGVISLFPNPTSDRFTLNVNGYTGGGDIKIDLINAVGQVVKTELVSNATEAFMKDMDVTTLASGTYTLRVKGNKAEANLRVVIAR
jgi:hypothetical protein